MSKRAVLYARVSKDDRRNATSSLDGQLNLCRAYALENGWEIITELTEDDRGACGAEFDLPKLTEALDMAKSHKFDILVTRELDRFSRGLAKQLVVEGQFKRAGVQIEYVLGDYPETPEGQLNKQIRAVIAEYEREKIKERMLSGRRRKVNAGNVMTHGPAPYGYLSVKIDDKVFLEIDEETAVVVRLIFQWYAHDGISVNEIVRRLSGQRIPTPTDKKNMRGVKKKKGFGQWSKATIHYILKNETYAGRWHYGKKSSNTGRNPKSYWIAVEVPAIISGETWQLAVERRQFNKANAKRNLKHDYLVRGFGICGHCGYKMQTHGYKNKSSVRTRHYFYYRCGVRANRTQHSHIECSLPEFGADDVDAVVWEEVKAFMTKPEKLRKGIRTYQAEREQANAPIKERLSMVDGLITDNQAQLDKLLDLYLSNAFPKDLLLERKSRLESIIDALKVEQASLNGKMTQTLSDEQIRNLEIFAAEIAEGIEVADKDFDTRRRIIENLGVQVTFAREGEDKVIYVRCEFGLNTMAIVSNNTRFAGPVAADLAAHA